MRSGRPSPRQLRDNFDRALAAALAGQGLRSCQGFDDYTDSALWAIARARPNVPDGLVEAARRAFAGQLDGSNSARRQEDLPRMLAERGAGSGTGEGRDPARPDGPAG
ncbi:hypothetical protein ABZZ17_16825 [Streptomyces sp. NPDC006512]|uniref:hypothetical protein n=1 Tax=Streptomyces sp. NPDC006512 TaxID=3154307 RepID=UPI00339F6310